MGDIITLAGRDYVEIGVGPIRQDLFMLHHARHAGLVDAEPRDGEDDQAYAERLLSQLMTSGRALLLLGAVLIPNGTSPTSWTEDLAHETAAHLGAIIDKEEKGKVYSQLLSLVLGFFVNGLASYVASRPSSASASAGPNQTDAGDAGPNLSERSPDSTSIEPVSSSDGR